jgi:hypothetical protein
MVVNATKPMIKIQGNQCSQLRDGTRDIAQFERLWARLEVVSEFEVDLKCCSAENVGAGQRICYGLLKRVIWVKRQVNDPMIPRPMG